MKDRKGDMETRDKIAEESWDKIHEKCWCVAISLVRENLCSRCPQRPCEVPCETAFRVSAYISLAAFMAKVKEN